MLIEIDQGNTRRYSKNMYQIRLPLVFTRACKVKAGSKLFFYRDTTNEDVLVLSAKKLKTN